MKSLWLILIILGVLLLVMGIASWVWGSSNPWFQLGLGVALIVAGWAQRRRSSV